MKDNYFSEDLDQLIRESIKLEDQPSAELNNRLKAALYQQEAA